MMKNYLRLLMVIAVLAAAVFVYKLWPHHPKYVRPHTESKNIVRSLIGSPVDLPTPGSTKEMSQPSNSVGTTDAEKKCLTASNEIAQMSLGRVIDLVMDQKQGLVLCAPTSTTLKDLVDKIKSDCVHKTGLTPEQKQNCSALIALYRASLIDVLTANEADLKRLSEAALLNKAFAIFNEGAWKDKASAASMIAKTDKIADELLRRRPNWDFAEKLKISARLLAGDFSAVAGLVEKALQIFPQDADFLDARYLALSQGSADHLLKAVDNHIRMFPNDPIDHYWKAVALHMKNDDKGAIAELQQAKWMDPGNARYEDTLKKLSSPDSDSAFNMQIQLPFDDMDHW